MFTAGYKVRDTNAKKRVRLKPGARESNIENNSESNSPCDMRLETW
jgi:hypothetical protein